jgi:DNA invertase Pin-like site-specific DNA recombinase
MARRAKIVPISSGPPRAVGYVRVSTGKQALSPEAQREKIAALATLQGVDLVDIVVDKESAKEGSIHRRPGIAQILGMVRRREISRILIAKLDRLTRSVVDLGELLTELDRAGVTLASATETWMDTGSAGGRLVVNIIVCVAQWEREAIAERTTAVLQWKKEHGQVYNHTPYGYERNGDKLIQLQHEQQVIHEIKVRRQAGESLREIAGRLNADVVPTKIPGRKWHASTIANILRAA